MKNKDKIYKNCIIGFLIFIIIYLLVILQRHGLGIDELDWTLRIVHGKTWKSLFRELALYGYNLPLYYVIIKILDIFFHYNKFLLLLPSAIMAIVGCYYIYLTSKKFFKTNFAILALMLSLSSLFFYKQIACSLRPYGLLYMLSAISFYNYLNRLKDNTKLNNFKYIISIILLLFTHWYGALVVLFYGITDFYFLLKKKISFKIFMLYIIPFILILSWVVYVFSIHIVTFGQYWADPPGVFSIIELIFELLGFYVFFIATLAIYCIARKKKRIKTEDDKIINIIFSYIVLIIAGIIVYSRFISPSSSLWVSRYFISIMPQFMIVVAFYIVKLYKRIIQDDIQSEINFITSMVAINLIIGFSFTLFFSYQYPNVGYEESYEKIFSFLENDDDIYNDDTLIICTYGKYWVDYNLFEKNKKLPSNLMIIDPYKYGNTNSEDAKLSELEYVIKDSKKYNKEFDINENMDKYNKIYIIELHRMLYSEEIDEIFDMDDFDVRLSEEYQIVKLTRNEE